jgi:YidC/Oxa1 family membrane protein insertase
MADSEKSQKSGGFNDLSMELRLLIAFILMGAVLFLTPYFIKPAPVVPTKAPVKAAQTTPTPSAVPTAAPATHTTPPATDAAPATLASKEETYTVETDIYRVVFSNRGAVVKDWILKRYKDSQPKPQQVDLVSAAGSATTGFPGSLCRQARRRWSGHRL